MNNLIIREALFTDIEEIAKLHIDSWYETYSGIISQGYLENMKNNLSKRIERMQNEFGLRNMIVAILNDEIVGFSEFVFSNEFSKDLDIDCELCGLYIKNEYKNLGLGSTLFEYVTNLFKKENKNKMGVWCIKENYSAISFYNKKGGTFIKEKLFSLGGKEYTEIAFLYNL